jgi:hypothetical protein
MLESRHQFSHKEVARRYIDIYEQMLARPLVEKESGEVIKAIAESLSESAAEVIPPSLIGTPV